MWRYLEAALQEPYEEIQSIAFDLLLEKKEFNSPEIIVRNYAGLLPSLRKRVRESKHLFLPVAREQTRRGTEAMRQNAYRMIEEVDEGEGTKLLSEGVRDPSPGVREDAAGELEKIALRYHYHLVNFNSREAPESKKFLDENQHALSRDLEKILQTYSLHRKSVFIDIVIESGTHFYRVVTKIILARTNSPLYDAFRRSMNAAGSPAAIKLLFRLLSEPEERFSQVAQRICGARRDPAFLLAIAEHLSKLSPEFFHPLATQTKEVPWWPALERNPEIDTKVVKKLSEFLAYSSVDTAGRDARLVSLLLNPSPEVRIHLLQLLHDIRSEKTLPAAVQLLRDEDAGVCESAALIIQDLHPENMVEILRPFLSSPVDGLRRVALETVGGISFDRYLVSFDTLDEQTRTLAGKALSKIDREMPQRLQKEIESLDSGRRMKALRIARMTEVTDELQPLFKELLADPDRKVRATVIRMVELSGNLEAMKLVASALRDSDRRVRANAVEAFEAVGDERFVKILLPLLQDPDNRVRANTGKALWTLGYREVGPHFREMLSSPRELMRLSAVWVLGEISFPGGRRMLEERLPGEGSDRVRRKIESVLKKLPATGGNE